MASFPQTPLPVSFHIAPGANPADPSTYAFTDITTDVRFGAGIQIRAGRQDEGSRVDTTDHRATLDNHSGNYSRRNPLGTWYGQLRSGTPIQTRVRLIDDLFARTVASGLGTDSVSGFTWSTNAGWSANGSNGLVTFAAANTTSAAWLPSVCGDDVNIYKVTSCSAVATGQAWVDATMVRYQDGNNFYRVHTEFQVGGTIGVKVTRVTASVATDILSIVSTSVAYSAGTKIATRIQAIGPTIRIKVWLASGSEPTAWSGSVNDSSTTVRGNAVGLYEWRLAGNTNAGSMSVSVYEFRVDAIRATTPVPEWSPRWDQSAKDATTPIVGTGVIRRLSQGQSALRSPMYRQITQYSTLVGHWPMEDPSTAGQLTNSVAGGLPGTVTGAILGASGGPPGAASVVQSSSGAILTGAFVSASTSAGWQISWSCKLTSPLPAANTEMVRWYTNQGYTWSWQTSSGAFRLLVTASDGSTVLDSSVAFTGGPDPTQWLQYRTKVHASGGTVTVERAWFPVATTTLYGFTDTFTGSASSLSGWLIQANTATTDALWCHLYGVTTNNDDLQSYNAVQSFSGYVGETAAARAIRLAGEEGVPLIVMGDPTISAAMGAQTPATFLELLRACEDADQGLLHERGAGLGYLTYAFRTNVPVSMALDFNQGHVAEPPEPTDDDLHLINTVKLGRTNGTEVTVQDNTSIALSGTYTDETTVNLYQDSQLADQAGWRLHLGTVDELRWPRIVLDLARNPSLIPLWCSLRIGSRFTVANPPSAVAGGSLDLIIEGYTETISLFSWDVEINCSPATAWDVGVYDTARYDSQTSTLAGPLTTSTTSWSVTAAVLGDCWDQAAVPYDVLVNGERCTVTAATAPAGTGPYTQTLTCTRAVNGIAKAHVTGESIRIATPGRYSL